MSTSPVVLENITGKASKRFGIVHPAPVAKGQNAEIVKGKSIRLFGTKVESRSTKGADGLYTCENVNVPYDLTFEIGGYAVYGSYNLVYTGAITSITEKTVTIVEDYTGEVHRLSIYEFNWRNFRYDAERIAEENAETRMCI